AVVDEAAAAVGRAAVLPDDGAVDGPAGGPVPEHRRLALVRQPEAGEIGGVEAGPSQGVAGDGELGVEDLAGVVLDPAGAGVVLRERLLGDGHDGAVGVEDEGAAGGGALVEGEEEGGTHGARVACCVLRVSCSITPTRDTQHAIRNTKVVRAGTRSRREERGHVAVGAARSVACPAVPRPGPCAASADPFCSA